MDLLVELLEMVGHVDTFQGSILAVADCTLLLLDHLPHPIVRDESQGDLLHAAGEGDTTAIQRLLRQLPEETFTTLRELMSLSVKMLDTPPLGVTPDTLAAVFAPVLLRPRMDRAHSAKVFVALLLQAEELNRLWLESDD